MVSPIRLYWWSEARLLVFLGAESSTGDPPPPSTLNSRDARMFHHRLRLPRFAGTSPPPPAEGKVSPAPSCSGSLQLIYFGRRSRMALRQRRMPRIIRDFVPHWSRHSALP